MNGPYGQDDLFVIVVGAYAMVFLVVGMVLEYLIERRGGK